MGLVSGVFSEVIPQDQALPAIRFSDQAPADVNTFNANRVVATGLYLVAVVARGTSYGPLATAADRLDFLLHKKSGTLAPLSVIQSWRDGAFRLAETEGDIQYRHLGGYYRVMAHAD